jgi:ppGpp synthetase/RelA/SpoT-type nucleotidyltranferase
VDTETRLALIEQGLRWFDERFEQRQALTDKLDEAVTERLKAAGLQHFRVEARVKTRKSFEDKLRKDPRRQIEDVIGARVLVFFRSDLVLAEDVLQRMLIFATGSYVDKADLLPDREFGYRSIQFIGRTKAGGWDATAVPLWEVLDNHSGEKIEVQIRTVLEHGFAEVEHDIRYKPGAAPVTPEVDRQFALTAALLEQADTNIDGIRMALHLGVEGTATPRAVDIGGWAAERFVQSSRASLDLDKRMRTALDLSKGHVVKSEREVANAASLAGWVCYADYQRGVEQYGALGLRMATACADTEHGVVLIDSEPQHLAVGFPGIGLFWTALAVALGINGVDAYQDHARIAIPDGRLAEFGTVAGFLVEHPEVPAPSVRDRYRPQAAPAGTMRRAEFREIVLTKSAESGA